MIKAIYNLMGVNSSILTAEDLQRLKNETDFKQKDIKKCHKKLGDSEYDSSRVINVYDIDKEKYNESDFYYYVFDINEDKLLLYEINEAQRNAEELSQEKEEIEVTIQDLENTKKKYQNEIKNAKDAISLLEKRVKEIEDKKDKADELEKDVEFYRTQIEKLKNKE